MDQVGKQNVASKAPRGRKGGERRVHQGGLVLQDAAQREARRELVVELGARDMIVEDAGTGAALIEPIKDIGIVDAQAVGGAQRVREAEGGDATEKGRQVCGRRKIDICAGLHVRAERNLCESEARRFQH